MFAVHGVNDNAARVGALEWFFERRNPQDKLWLGQWDHGVGCCPNRRGIQWTEALHAWFDKQLAQRKVNTGPPIEVFMSDDQTFSNVTSGARTEILTGEDLAGRRRQDHLLPRRRRRHEPHGADGGGIAVVHRARRRASLSLRAGRDGVSFATEPFEQDVVMAGLPTMELVASVTAPRVHLIANLLDEGPDAEGEPAAAHQPVRDQPRAAQRNRNGHAGRSG